MNDLPVQFNRVPEWLESLPIANTQESAERLTTLLNRLNRYPLSANDRETILSHCKEVATTLIAGLRKPLARPAFPLSKKPQQAADTIQQLLTEFAIGHKILVVELANARLVPGKKHRLGDALVAACHYLSELIVHCYSLYIAVPSGSWQDIHALFSFARDEGFRNREHLREDVAHAYKRICLLALSNPYQLMYGEAKSVYTSLDHWSDSVELTKLAGNRPPEGVYYTDLASDHPPRYAVTADNPETEEAYAFAVEGLLREIATCCCAWNAPGPCVGAAAFPAPSIFRKSPWRVHSAPVTTMSVVKSLSIRNPKSSPYGKNRRLRSNWCPKTFSHGIYTTRATKDRLLAMRPVFARATCRPISGTKST